MRQLNYVPESDYEYYMRSDDWRAKRTERLEMDGYTCQVCGRTDAPLQVHHRSYANLGNESLDELITVCKPCHSIISQIEREVEEKAREIERDYLWMLDITGTHSIDKYDYKHPYRVVGQMSVRWRIRDVLCEIIMRAIIDHSEELPNPNLNDVRQQEIRGYVDNILEVIRDNRRQEIDDLLTGHTFRIMHTMKANTRKLGIKVSDNVAKFSSSVESYLSMIPHRRDYGWYLDRLAECGWSIDDALSSS